MAPLIFIIVLSVLDVMRINIIITSEKHYPHSAISVFKIQIVCVWGGEL